MENNAIAFLVGFLFAALLFLLRWPRTIDLPNGLDLVPRCELEEELRLRDVADLIAENDEADAEQIDIYR